MQGKCKDCVKCSSKEEITRHLYEFNPFCLSCGLLPACTTGCIMPSTCLRMSRARLLGSCRGRTSTTGGSSLWTDMRRWQHQALAVSQLCTGSQQNRFYIAAIKLNTKPVQKQDMTFHSQITDIEVQWPDSAHA